MISLDFLRLQDFIPGLSIPPDAYPSLLIAFALLLVSIYTLTIDSPGWAVFRFALVPLTISYFWDFGFGQYECPSNQVAIGLAVVGLYGIMRVLETSVVGIFDENTPCWIVDGKEVPIPDTLKGRLFYTIDLATSLRGNSWCSDRHWNWAPKRLISFPQKSHTQGQYLRIALLSLIQQYILYDAFDTLVKSRRWDTGVVDPVTRLPFHEQLIYSLTVCATTALSISVPYTLTSTNFVLLGSSPSNWPPMFDEPFSATSLADFWTKRWHLMFRRVFERLSQGILRFLPIPKSPSYIYKHARATIIFALSATMHILIMYRLDRMETRYPKTFLDISILKFFLSQPLGLAIEALVVIPLTRKLLPADWETSVTRIWAWCFMLWAGRYWSDVWVHRGLWEPTEKVVGYSVVRGLLYGKWVVE